MIGKHIVPQGDYSISVEVHAELLNENNYRYLEHFTLFDIGLQSITPQALGHLRRGFNQPRFLRGVELLKRLKGQTNIYLILGLPGENFFSFLLSVKFAVACDVSRLFINHLCVLNGTTLRREAAELKLRHKPTPPYHATSNYSFGGGELSMAHLFAETMVREHDCAVAMSPGVISPS